MTLFTAPISCLACGADLALTQSVAHRGSSSISLLTCPECKRQWSVSAQMRQIVEPESMRRREYRALASA